MVRVQMVDEVDLDGITGREVIWSSGLADFRRHRRRVRRVRSALTTAALLGLGAAVVLAITSFAFQFFQVPSGSMLPTLEVGDRILVQKIGLDRMDLRPGDIVVFKRPPNDDVDPGIPDLVKRIVAVGGQTVSCEGGHLLVNGKVATSSYLPKGTVTADVSTETVPAGDYYVMGDNRTDSYDSRFFGPIKASSVVGRVLAQVWPLSAFKVF